MESFLAWLSTPVGSDLIHAVILVLMAAAAFLNYKAHAAAAETRDIARSRLSVETEKGVLPKDGSNGGSAPLV